MHSHHALYLRLLELLAVQLCISQMILLNFP